MVSVVLGEEGGPDRTPDVVAGRGPEDECDEGKRERKQELKMYEMERMVEDGSCEAQLARDSVRASLCNRRVEAAEKGAGATWSSLSVLSHGSRLTAYGSSRREPKHIVARR